MSIDYYSMKVKKKHHRLDSKLLRKNVLKKTFKLNFLFKYIFRYSH